MDEKRTHKAPDRFERAGLSLVGLQRLFPSDRAAERWFEKARWPNGVAHPHCGDRDKRTKAAGGPVGKAIVAGVRDRETGRVAVHVVPDTSARTLTKSVADHADPGATVFTDEAHSHNPLTWIGFKHESVRHSTGQFVDRMAHTNGMEGKQLPNRELVAHGAGNKPSKRSET